MKKDPMLFVKHILENINDIEEFSEGLHKAMLAKDRLHQKAIIRSLEVIGEAAKNIPASFRDEHPTIEWSKITGLRDKLIHQYFGIDLDTIWDIIIADLPKLKKEIENTQKGTAHHRSQTSGMLASLGAVPLECQNFPRYWWRAKPYATGPRPDGNFCAF